MPPRAAPLTRSLGRLEAAYDTPRGRVTVWRGYRDRVHVYIDEHLVGYVHTPAPDTHITVVFLRAFPWERHGPIIDNHDLAIGYVAGFGQPKQHNAYRPDPNDVRDLI